LVFFIEGFSTVSVPLFPLFYLHVPTRFFKLNKSITMATREHQQAPEIDFNFYEQPSTISYFNAILDDLKNDLGSIGVDTTFTAPELAYFIPHFLKFQRRPEVRTTRIPVHFFEVESLATRPSPLYTILQAAYRFQSDKDISDWHFDAPEDVGLYVELVEVVKKQLIQEGFYQLPVIAFDESVKEQEKADWTRLVYSLGGKLERCGA
jgi:hypothetical protein